jgi:hypothetical protein
VGAPLRERDIGSTGDEGQQVDRQQLQAAGAVLAIAVAAFVRSGIFLEVGLSRYPSWLTVIDGALMGAAVLATWTLARSRRAAAAGLMTAALLGLLGTVAFEPALIFFRASVGWAVLLALGVRIAMPDARPAAEDARERAVS